MNRFDFSGRKVLITGASAGIGKALSGEFARRGAHLALGALPEEARDLEKWASELKAQFGIPVWTFPINLLDEDGPDSLYREVKAAVGNIFALVNNAGIVAYGQFWETSWKRQEDTMKLNLFVPMRLMRLFIKDMVEKGEGVVFNISSVSALQPTPFHTVYGASKAGLQSLSQGVRAELKGTGVTVCTLNPPYIETRLIHTGGFPEVLRFYSISGKKSTQWLAEKALKAFEKGKMLYIPGFSNKVIHNFMVRISPRSMVDSVSRFFLQERKRHMDSKRGTRQR
jgi:short-subunit dehydrogenase